MVGNQAVIIAGIGCRTRCPAADIVALLHSLGGAEILAAPDWKRDEAGLLEAAERLALPLRFVSRAALDAVQSLCPSQSQVTWQAVGLGSIAEAAALAGGGRLLRSRAVFRWATCALAHEGAGLSESRLS